MKTRLPMLLAIVALLMMAAVVAQGSSAVPVGEGKPLLGFLRLPTFNPPKPTRVRVIDEPETPGWWVDIIAWAVLMLPFVLLGLAMVFAFFAIARNLRGRRIRLLAQTQLSEDANEPDPPSARLLRAARAAQAEFAEHQGGPPADAVIAAWLRLEAAAASSGTRRHAHQTPTEFTNAVLADHPAVGPALERLRRLYHRARFAEPGSVSAPDVDAARLALDQIVHALTPEAVR